MAQLREGSVIKKPTGDEVIATVNDIKITSVNGQTGDIELTGEDIDYFDYEVAHYRSVGSTINEINDTIYAFMAFIIGAGYDIDNDPTLKEILEMLTIILGDYELGVDPSLGEIVEETESNKITVGATQPTNGWWFEEI